MIDDRDNIFQLLQYFHRAHSDFADGIYAVAFSPFTIVKSFQQKRFSITAVTEYTGRLGAPI